jgi:hypothetical protein
VAEPYGLVFYKKIALAPLTDNSGVFITALRSMVTHVATPPVMHRWELDTDDPNNSDHLLLKHVSSARQVLVTRINVPTETGTLSIIYAPNGGITFTGATLDPLPPDASPERYITANVDGSIDLNALDGSIYYVEYDDAVAFTLSSFPLTHWVFGAMAGTLFYPLHNSDDEYVAGATPDSGAGTDFPPTQPRPADRRMGEAVLVGMTRKLETDSWLTSSAATPIEKSGSVLRTSLGNWTGLVIDNYPTTFTSEKTDGLDRFAPYWVRPKNEGFLGLTKYIRTSRLDNKHRSRYVSTTMEPNGGLPPSLVPSQQAWIGYSGPTSGTNLNVAEANINNVILWRRGTPIVVP